VTSTTSPPNASPVFSEESLFSRTFLLILAVQFSAGVPFATFSLLPKYLLAERHEQPWVLGVSEGAFALVGVLLTPWVGRWLDNWGRRRVLLISLLTATASYWPFAFANDTVAFVVLRAVHGVAFVLEFIACGTLVVDIAPIGRRAEAIGYFGAAGMVTNAAGPAVGEAIAAGPGWGWAFAQCSAWSLLGLYCARKLPETAVSVHGGISEPHIVYSSTLLCAYLGSLALGVGVGVTRNYVSALALVLGATVIAPLLAAFSVGAIVQRAFFGFIPDRIGAERATFLSLLVYGIAVLALAGGSGQGVFVALCLVVGLAHGTAYPAITLLAIQEVGGNARGRATAHITGAFNLGLLLSTAGLAPLAPVLGFRALIACGGLTLLLVAACFSSRAMAVFRAIQK
jgi:MFS family permease